MSAAAGDGSYILVDRRSSESRHGRIYVVRTDEGLIVKRLERDAAGTSRPETQKKRGRHKPGAVQVAGPEKIQHRANAGLFFGRSALKFFHPSLKTHPSREPAASP